MAKKNTDLAADLEALGFERAISSVKPTVYVALDGLDKSGRTNWSLEKAPGPIAVIDINRGLEGVIQKYQKKKDIFVKRIATTSDQAQAVANLGAFVTAWNELLPKLKGGTLVVDNFGEIWEMARFAAFGKASARAREYGELNASMDEILDAPYDHDANVILIHDLKEEYLNDSPSGNYARWGYKNVRKKVQVNLLLEYREGFKLVHEGMNVYSKAEDAESKAKPDFYMTVVNNRFDPEMRGKEWKGKDVNFKTLASYIHDDVPASHWD